MKRECGDCQLCCKLLPVPPLGKKGGETCQFQKFHKGCSVYHKPKMPPECGFWNCRWLVNDDMADQSRPDRSHIVVDLLPDFITLRHDDTGEEHNIQVLQCWIDPKFPDAHRSPSFRAYLERCGAKQIAALVRFNERDALVVFPAGDGER